MKFTFIEKKMAPSDSLRAYAEKKVSKIDRLFRTESEANVTFSTERGRFTAEITIKNNGTFFRAHETTSDMYASVDSAVATIERQIRKNKTRLAKKLREGAFEREVQPEYVPEDDTVEAGADGGQLRAAVVIVGKVKLDARHAAKLRLERVVHIVPVLMVLLQKLLKIRLILHDHAARAQLGQLRADVVDLVAAGGD